MRYLFFVLVLFSVNLASGQISIDYPYQNQIFQRDQNNIATVSFLGKVSKEATKVEYQLVAIQNGIEQKSTWNILDSTAIGGFYQAKLDIPGGFYKFKVRSFNSNKLLDSTVLNRFGVGEVFIIAGQSNAQGVGRKEYPSGTKNEMVISANFSNYLEPDSLDTYTYIGKDSLNYPTNKFEVLTSSSIIGPLGNSNYYWPILGEKIANTLNVPVCFFNVAWGGTSIRNWAESSRGIASKNPWIDQFYAPGFPFVNLKQVLKSYAGINGVRAVLWQIGETDTRQLMPTDTFIAYFKEVQQAISKIAGLDIPMVLANSTYIGRPNDSGICVPYNQNTSVTDAIKNLIEVQEQNFITGPNTDLIEIPRLTTPVEDCVHFSPNAFPALATSWFESLQKFFGLNKSIFKAFNLPILDKYCVANNDNAFKANNKQFFDLVSANQVVASDASNTFINLTGNNFKWVYKKDTLLKFESPTFSIAQFPIPNAPILTAGGPTQFCDGNLVELSANVMPAIWNTKATTKSIVVNKSGEYNAYTISKFNCVSAPSANLQVKVFENPKAPTITQTTPYFLYGGIKLFDTEFKWAYNKQLLTNADVFLKVNKSGNYQLFASKTYTPSVTCSSPVVEFAYTLPNDGGLTAFPNPVGTFGKLNIESVSNLNNAFFQLAEVSGRIIKEGNINTSDAYTLDVNNVPTGKYILSIFTTDNAIYKKSIIIGK